jgi:hypothetical protein
VWLGLGLGRVGLGLWGWGCGTGVVRWDWGWDWAIRSEHNLVCLWVWRVIWAHSCVSRTAR